MMGELQSDDVVMVPVEHSSFVVVEVLLVVPVVLLILAGPGPALALAIFLSLSLATAKAREATTRAASPMQKLRLAPHPMAVSVLFDAPLVTGVPASPFSLSRCCSDDMFVMLLVVLRWKSLLASTL